MSRHIHSLLPVFLILLFFTAGCAEINPFETPGDVLQNPLGNEAIRPGMTKNEVVMKWGEPDIINKIPSKDASGSHGEEWVYKSRNYTPVPIDAGYLHKNQYLYFDGNNLTRVSDKPL